MSRRIIRSKAFAVATPVQAQPINPFAGFDDWMEEKEPGYKAKKAVERAEREAKRLDRCERLLMVFGSEDAVFEPTALEAALRDALDHLRDPLGSIWGYRDFKLGNPTPEMWQAIRQAVAVPETVPKAWAAYRDREALEDARIAFCPDYTPYPWEEAWRAALETLLDNLRTPTREGIDARLEWMSFLANREFSRGHEKDQAVLSALREDFAAMMSNTVNHVSA